jgi:hypothetical protein
MNLQMRIDLSAQLGEYILSADPGWIAAKERASLINPWFTPAFINLAGENIAKEFLTTEKLTHWSAAYNCEPSQQKSIGIVMAGNIPLVGFHDLLCVFFAGHKARIKASSKDDVLLKHLVEKMSEWESNCRDLISFSEMLKGCDSYIATGSNNSARYFEYYFGKWPNIIRRNRTSVAVLEGTETNDELVKLADDVHLYFGMGCRNVTKIFVPAGYDFLPLLTAFRKYEHFKDHNKYKNNYDYHLALHILNNKYYMANESIILVENPSIFSPVSQLNYEFYNQKNELVKQLEILPDVQCIVGKGFVPFGNAQTPSLTDYADGIDTMKFLTSL